MSASEQLAEWARANLPRLINEATAATARSIPDYYGDGDTHAVSMRELSRSIAGNLKELVSVIADPSTDWDREAPTVTGRRRALQRVPLPEVLRAYRISFATLWDALVEQVERRGSTVHARTLIDSASVIWQFTDEHAVVLTEAYRKATAELLLAEQRRRSALIEAVLTGRPGPDAQSGEASALLGFPSDAHLVVVAAETRGLADESLPNVEVRLAEHGIVSGWRLQPAQQLGIVAIRDDQRDLLITTLTELATARAGLSPAYSSISDSPRALQLAKAALSLVPRGEARLQVFDASPLAALVVSVSTEGNRLAEDVLGPVLRQPEEDRDLLLQTLQVYVDESGSAERSADVLYCHPNTVRNRLRRIQELTGRSITDPRGIAELTTAAYALRLEPATRIWSNRPRAF